VLALCDCTAAQLVSAALAAGASGVVCREASPGELVQAVRVVAAGNVCLPAGVTRDLARTRLRRAAAAASGPLSALSAREREVLALTAQGYSSREIGESLRLSHKTVETYRHRLMDKLEIHHRSDLVRAAVRGGLLDAPA
ncbi:MAG TPA: response regulator transcription factor, partial [Longimicrobium sp.]|nr:response regulator transcription factor [Longimicrobium sp.]